MKKLLTILFLLTCWSRAETPYYLGTFVLAPTSAVSFQNISTNIIYGISGLTGVFSNQVATTGEFNFWQLRGTVSNRVWGMNFGDVTNFVWVESIRWVFYQDVIKFENKTTNHLFLTPIAYKP